MYLYVLYARNRVAPTLVRYKNTNLVYFFVLLPSSFNLSDAASRGYSALRMILTRDKVLHGDADRLSRVQPRELWLIAFVVLFMAKWRLLPIAAAWSRNVCGFRDRSIVAKRLLSFSLRHLKWSFIINTAMIEVNGLAPTCHWTTQAVLCSASIPYFAIVSTINRHILLFL